MTHFHGDESDNMWSTLGRGWKPAGPHYKDIPPRLADPSDKDTRRYS